ncbi:MAG: hypothetical protein ACI4SM_03415 [Candidatus Gastranaerophilaceae bacterium]
MKYKKGDLVIVRDWNDMYNEYPSGYECIDTPFYAFVTNMKKYCNKLHEIQYVYNDGYKLNDTSGYMFTDEMLILAKES